MGSILNGDFELDGHELRVNLQPPHPIFNESYAHTLAASMRLQGWDGRPLLVCADGNSRFGAWTGTHRLRAAEIVGIEKIPVIYVKKDLLIAAGWNESKIRRGWEHRNELAAAGDPRAHAVMKYEEEWQRKRGW
jgi:ParB-like chromosome segregation protein Spo0J